MMDFRASHAASRSSGLIGHDSKCRVVKRRSDRFPFIIEQCTYATFDKNLSPLLSLQPSTVLRPALPQLRVESRHAKLCAVSSYPVDIARLD